MHPTFQRVRQVDPSHLGLTYPLYARQLDAFIADGTWVAFDARIDGKVVGLLVAYVGPERADVLSVAVGAAFRRQGIGSRLLAVAGEYCREAHLQSLEISFRSDLANVETLLRLLAKSGWSRPEIPSVVGRSDTEAAVTRVLAFADRFPVKFNATIVPWAEVPKPLREELESADGDDRWYPATLSPSRFISPFTDTQASSTIIHDGRIVGWMIVHVAESNPIKADFSCAFVHPIWQRRAALLWLLAHALRSLRDRYPHFSTTWTMGWHRGPMREFILRRLVPLGVEMSDLLSSHAPGFPPPSTYRAASISALL